MSTRLCAVSVDLDEIHHYDAIHGLPAGGRGTHAVYDLALARMDSLARSLEVPLTLFAVGEDLARAESAAALSALAARGHAVENHSLGHRYDLVRLGPDEIAAQIEGGIEAIARAVGARPTGFRAPGYTVSDAVFDALEAAGVAFDSSVFPCPAYYGAKAAVMGGMRLLGRRSASVLDTPRVLAAPARPYRPGTPWWRRGARRFVELPIQVTPLARLPVIGTSIALAGTAGARLLARSCAGEALVNLELHGIDFLDASDGLDALVAHQPELCRPLARRLDALSAFVEVLRRAGHAFVRLDEAARAFG
jgi:peptidoglycan/xylan/chitin deacetylase (PgdA/CDA1 family)